MGFLDGFHHKSKFLEFAKKSFDKAVLKASFAADELDRQNNNYSSRSFSMLRAHSACLTVCDNDSASFTSFSPLIPATYPHTRFLARLPLKQFF